MKKKVLVSLLLLFLVIAAIAIRWCHFQNMKQHNPVFDLPIVDSAEYTAYAKHYVEETLLGPPHSYYHPPFYAYFVAFVFKVFGESINTVRVVQILIDGLNVLLIFFIAFLVFNKSIALVSSALYALYIPFIKFSIEILPPILSISLLLLTILLLLLYTRSRKGKKRSPVYLIFSSLCLGLLIVTLPNFLLCLPVIIGWLFIQRNKTSSTKLKYIILYIIITLLPSGIAALRNYVYAREPVFISNNGGVNFYIGNNPDMHRTVAIRPGLEWDSFISSAYQEERITNFSEVSNFWFKKALNFIVHQPGTWLIFSIEKSILFLNSHEFPRNYDMTFFDTHSWVSRLPVVRLNIILPLALCGILILFFATRIKTEVNNGILLILLIMISYSFSVILFFITARYRLSVIPLFIMFAAFGVYTLIHGCIRKHYLTILQTIIFMIACVLFTCFPFFRNKYPYTINRSHTYGLIAESLVLHNRLPEAKRFFQKSITQILDSSTYELYYYYAHYNMLTGNPDEAIRYLNKSIELRPTHHAFTGLGVEFKRRGHYDTAIDYFNQAIQLSPCYTSAYLNMVDCYFMQKDFQKALFILESYSSTCPSPHPAISYRLGVLYMDLVKDWERAIPQFETVIKYPQAHDVGGETYSKLGLCHFYLGDQDQAKRVWSQGLKRYPDYPPIVNNLKKLR